MFGVCGIDRGAFISSALEKFRNLVIIYKGNVQNRVPQQIFLLFYNHA